jgi:hypothetical protein
VEVAAAIALAAVEECGASAHENKKTFMAVTHLGYKYH